MMESAEYDALRASSSALFNNGLLLPTAVVILEGTAIDGSFAVSQLRTRLGGRAESNQIRDVVGRIATVGAAHELPYPGRPHPRMWIRSTHPFWEFIDDWAQLVLTSEGTSARKRVD